MTMFGTSPSSAGEVIIRIDMIDTVNQVVFGVDGNGKQIQAPLVRVGKGGLPKVGEYWTTLRARVGGQWHLYACLVAIKDDVTGDVPVNSARSSTIEALDQLGFVEDLTREVVDWTFWLT